LLLSDGFYDFVGAFVCEVGVYDEDGVNDARYPQEQGQDDIQEELNWLSTEQDGKGRQDNSEYISHYAYPLKRWPD